MTEGMIACHNYANSLIILYVPWDNGGYNVGLAAFDASTLTYVHTAQLHCKHMNCILTIAVAYLNVLT